MRRVAPFLGIFIVVSVVMGQDNDRAASYLFDGSACLDKGDFEGASRRFEEAYNWQPSFQAAFGAGFSYFKLKRFSEAELWFQKASAIDPGNEQAAVYLASAQIANSKTAEALGQLENFVRDHPRSARAAATLEAIRDDLRPRSFRAGGTAGVSLYLASAAAVFFLLFFGSFLLPDAGLRAVGRGLGWSALTSFLLLVSLPAILAVLGYLWGALLCARGLQEHWYHKGHGSWSRKIRSDLFRVAGVFAGVSGQTDRQRLRGVLEGLIRAGLNKSIVREIEEQLQGARPDTLQTEEALQKFSRAGRRFRREVLRLLVSVAVEVGWNRQQERLLKDFAGKLQMQHLLPSMLAEVGITAAKAEGFESKGTAPDFVAQSRPDPLLPYFRILEIPPSADRSRVKSGYRRQARRYHPDMIARADAAASSEQFRRVHEAYQHICRARGWEE
ncbi:MAG TPA: DnaJ domain-containing protein [Acidobacteriota bacterium]|jgi:tetratricopeptide (TPR) repeat protein